MKLEHLEHLRILFQRLNDVVIQLSKCCFGKSEVQF